MVEADAQIFTIFFLCHPKSSINSSVCSGFVLMSWRWMTTSPNANNAVIF